MVKFFLQKGISANSRGSDEKYCLLYTTSINANFPMIKILAKYGAKMENETDTGVVSAFHRFYPSQTAYDIVKCLLNLGCNVENGHRHACALSRLAQGFGRPPNKELIRRNNEELTELLHKKRFDRKNCQDECWKKGTYHFRASALKGYAFLEYIKGGQPAA